MDKPEPEKSTVELGRAGTADARLGKVLDDALNSDSAPADLADLPDIGNRNRFIDDYEILDEPPRAGGMGVVHKARHLKLGRVVAIKMLLAKAASDDTARKRFLKEARAIASLKHDNIIRVLDYGELEGRPFFTMEFVEKNLADQVRQRSLEPTEAARCVEVLALAVQAAHDHDVLHRDLKPSNILVDPEGKFLVADFGLAKAVTPGAEENITLHEGGMGTPSYMAPEQISGKACRQSDVYALGAILYFLLAGRPPFLGATDMETLMLVQSNEPVVPSQLNQRVSPDLEAVCLKCLEKRPGARYGSAKELAEDLHRYLNDEPTLARPLGRVSRLFRLAKRHPRETALAAVLAGVLLAGTIISTLFYLKADESRAKHFSELQKSQILRANDAAASHKLPDALALLSQVLRANATNQLAAERLLFLLTHRQVPLPISAPMPSGDHILSTRFSSDGKQLLVLSMKEGRRLWLGDPYAAKLVHRSTLPGSNAIGRVAISPDLQRVALTDSMDGQGTVFVYDVATGAELSKVGPLRPDLRLVSFSADGRSLRLFWKDGTVQDWSGGPEWNRPSARPAVTLADWTNADATGAVFSDDGRLVATIVDQTAIGVWDASSGKRQARLAHGHRDSLPIVAFGAGGSRLISYDPWLEGKPSELRVWNWSAGELVSQLKQAEPFQGLSLSSDGTRLAIVGDKQPLVWIWNVAAGHPAYPVGEPMACPGYPPVEAVLSPDRRSLLTITQPDSSTVADHGSVARTEPLVMWDLQPRTPAPGALGQLSDVKHAVISQDGRLLAVTQNSGTSSEAQGTNYAVQIWELARQRLAGPALLHDAAVESLAFNSNATLLVTGAQDAKARLWVVGTNVVLTEFLGHANWVNHAEFDPAGSQVLTSDGVVRLWSLGSSAPSRLLHQGDEQVRRAVFSPDGRWVVTAAEDGLARLWDRRTLQCVVTQSAPSAISQVLFSPDSSCVAMAARDNQGTVQVWPTPPTRAVARRTQIGHLVNHLAFSPDGRLLLASCAGGFASFRDVDSLQSQGPALQHPPEVEQAVFSLDGERVATLSKDGTVIVWNAAWRLPISDRMDSGLERALGIAFDGPGQRLITYGLGGVKLFDVPRAAKRSPTWLPELAETIAGQRLSGTDISQPVSIEKYDSLRAALLAAPATDAMTRWAQKFLGKPIDRTTDWP